jgi:recombination protein RecA
MPSAAAIRSQIESALAHKIPSALTPAARLIRPVAATGISILDATLHGGLPIGAISELCGPECSGRTGVALSFLARLTQDKFCVWIDASNALDPLSAAAAGVTLSRMLWVRCGAEKVRARTGNPFALPKQCFTPPPITRGLHGGGHGNHPRQEVKGLPEAVSGLFTPSCAQPQSRHKPVREPFESSSSPSLEREQPVAQRRHARQKTSSLWTPLEQALRACDLLLQAGGFGAIVLDLGSVAPEYASRIPLATWFRYRAAAERTQASFLLLTQTSCAKSSAELLLHFEPANAIETEPTVFTELEATVEISRRRFSSAEEAVTPFRKPPQNARPTRWTSRATWAGQP